MRKGAEEESTRDEDGLDEEEDEVKGEGERAGDEQDAEEEEAGRAVG